MKLSEVAELLGRTEVCQGLSAEERMVLAECGRIQAAFQDATILVEGEPGDTMIMLLDGEAQVEKLDPSGAPQRLATVPEGAVLGEIALLVAAPRTATVRAAGAVRYFEIGRSAFAELLAAADTAALKMCVGIARTLARRQVSSNERIVSLKSELASIEGAGQVVDGFLNDLVIEWED